jgi:hypothetical protein
MSLLISDPLVLVALFRSKLVCTSQPKIVTAARIYAIQLTQLLRTHTHTHTHTLLSHTHTPVAATHTVPHTHLLPSRTLSAAKHTS